MMMMMGEAAHQNPAIHAPPWSLIDDAGGEGLGFGLPVSGVTGAGGGEYSPYLLGEAALAALQRYLPSNEPAYGGGGGDSDDGGDLSDAPVDAYSCDEFRMYEFKIRRCARGRSHDWTECPYAHLGEKARRRDPRKYHYSGTACPDFRKGNCKRGDACEFAHGVFECWLHPTRYRTQPCKDGTACRRRVCFFAHTPDQLRVLSPTSSAAAAAVAAVESYDGSPLRRHALEDYFPTNLISPPLSPPSESPPLSPCGGGIRRASWPVAGSAMNEVLASLRQLQLSKVKSMPPLGSSWGHNLGVGGGGLLASPRPPGFRSEFCSLPTTPTRMGGGGSGWLEGRLIEEQLGERVESGRAIRAKMFEKLRQESVTDAAAAAPAPDVDWISELIK